MSKDLLMSLMTAWDKVDGAAQRVLVAQPNQMTKAAEDLDTARREMRTAVQSLIRTQVEVAR